MGCVLAKGPSMGSPSQGSGLDARKREGDYLSARDAFKHQLMPEDGRGGGGGGRASSGDGENEGRAVALPPPPPPQPVRTVDGGEDELVRGLPEWLVRNVPPEVLADLISKSADCYEKLEKVGQGTYSNVYKARDRDTGKIVALKKVRFETSEPESVKFMAREIMILQKLDHPNVIKLEGLATSRMHYSLYLVFEFMQYDLSRIISRPDTRLTEAQVKYYMKQLLSGLKHCHERRILHRDIKGSNLLIDKNGVLKIADFGLANFYHPNKKVSLTSRVVTLWYRAPELLLGTTDYGVGIDLWSAGCLLAEMFSGKPIMQGRNEVDQLHKIFSLCGPPSADYWRKLKLPNSSNTWSQYRPSIAETYKELPPSALSLLTVLLALDPTNRGTASSALESNFFTTNPLAYDLSGLPVICKETDESIQPREHRKQKAVKTKQRQRNGERKLESVNLFGTSGSPVEEKPADSRSSSQEVGSSTGSTSSSIKPEGSTLIRVASLSQITYPTEEEEQRRNGHPPGYKNIKNFPPIYEADDEFKNSNMHQYVFVKRSVSASDLGRYHGKHISKASPD
ncbi:hypothetical protein Cni_G09207 [Canna indica]|uniref:[RNA-polymerase]-subunit kinase n=1 Tax=Canna indica TaxID=4628 RepID=A0AAQ3Q7I6_9LILI|nr:hypothetical protein Cni_G09207 [Canna indica]